MDYNVIDCIEFQDIDGRDAPDFCDAFISYAEGDGKPLTADELDELNEDSDFVYNALMNYIY